MTQLAPSCGSTLGQSPAFPPVPPPLVTAPPVPPPPVPELPPAPLFPLFPLTLPPHAGTSIPATAPIVTRNGARKRRGFRFVGSLMRDRGAIRMPSCSRVLIRRDEHMSYLIDTTACGT